VTAFTHLAFIPSLKYYIDFGFNGAKTDRHDVTEILLKVVLSTIKTKINVIFQ
jgi:hypothetical protein